MAGSMKLGGPSAPVGDSALIDNSTGKEEPSTVASRRGRISLTMIVRDEERHLRRCLSSVRGLFDEIILVDTGSKDRSKEIAAEFGARVFDFRWIDDFSAARNVSLANATGHYACWLDADDVIDDSERSKLDALFRSLPADSSNAYVMRCVSDPDKEGKSGAIVVDHVRLFPLRDDIRWVYRVHEQILPALLRTGIALHWTDIVVRHTGYADGREKAAKRQRDWTILFKELADRPNDPFLFYNIGMIAFERQQWLEALGYFRCGCAALPRAAENETLRRKLSAMIAWSHQILGDHGASLRVCEEGLAVDAEDAELWFRKAVALRYLGQRDAAEACWRHILGLRMTDRFRSIDAGIYGHLTRRNLATIAAERGDRAEAQAQWRAVLVECPGDPDATRHLTQTVVRP
jgi:glycosyltransferase involved in cell wall biosynthesis